VILGWDQPATRESQAGPIGVTQEHGIQALGKRHFPVMTTDSRHDLPIAPNLLDCNFTVAAPNTAWASLSISC